MPTVEELERIEALITRLTPLSTVQRGELIRAENWNAVVAALIEVARTILEREGAGAVATHEHIDEVNVGWLDPRLRALVEKGPLGEPTAVARLDNLERRIALDESRVEQLQETAKEARNLASDIALREEKRDTDLKDVRRNLDAIPDAREDVLSVRETLEGLQGDLRRAIEIGEGLQVDGEPLNAPALYERVGALEELRERLTNPDGTILDANALERRLTELINTFVTQPELDEVIAQRPVSLTEAQRALLEEDLANTLGPRFSAEVATSTNGLRAEMNDRFSGVDATISGAIADARPEITESAVSAVREEIASNIATSRTELRNELLATLDVRLGEASQAATTLFESRAAQLEASLQSRLTDQLRGEINAAVEPLTAEMTRLNVGMSANSETVSRLGREQVEASARVEAIARDSEVARRALETALRAEMDRRFQEQNAAFEARFRDMERVIADRTNLAVQDAARSLRAELEQMAVTIARREAQLTANQLRAEFRGAVRDEVTLRLNDPALRSSPGSTAAGPATTQPIRTTSLTEPRDTTGPR